ncbi:Poly(Hydroxyalkanoate) granule-associated protein [Burkholderiales bacterium]|jgi:poly(hydroxyalkanoate) granule-associated protein|nr:Poly(Hydroxyalkanoate) granule-associated protein [Burkholderiales bacterium]
MPRKLKELAQAGGEGQLAAGIRESANQIWLAGVGAFAKAQKEGTKIFDLLVEEGETIQKQAKKSAQDAFGEIKAKASKSWDQLSWVQLERVFEDRVARALHTLNVPTRKDLDTLSNRVAELTAVTKKLSETMQGPGRARPARGRGASKRT